MLVASGELRVGADGLGKEDGALTRKVVRIDEQGSSVDTEDGATSGHFGLRPGDHLGLGVAEIAVDGDIGDLPQCSGEGRHGFIQLLRFMGAEVVHEADGVSVADPGGDEARHGRVELDAGADDGGGDSLLSEPVEGQGQSGHLRGEPVG